MKSVYIIYDEVAEEIITSFHASNDEHAIQKIKNDIQRNPMDVKFKVFKVCDVEVYKNKSICISSNCGTYNYIFEYPFTIQQDEIDLKDNISMEE